MISRHNPGQDVTIVVIKSAQRWEWILRKLVSEVEIVKMKLMSRQKISCYELNFKKFDIFLHFIMEKNQIQVQNLNLRVETIRAFKAIIMFHCLFNFNGLCYRQASFWQSNKVRESNTCSLLLVISTTKTENTKQNPTTQSA